MGREWNDKLTRKLQDSTCRAADRPRAGKLLVTDLEPGRGQRAPHVCLVEVLDEAGERVIAEFLVNVARRPKTPRYRDDRDWPTPKQPDPPQPPPAAQPVSDDEDDSSYGQTQCNECGELGYGDDHDRRCRDCGNGRYRMVDG